MSSHALEMIVSPLFLRRILVQPKLPLTFCSLVFTLVLHLWTFSSSVVVLGYDMRIQIGDSSVGSADALLIAVSGLAVLATTVAIEPHRDVS